ncbi:NUMOD4 domain-containing protein [uncultured Empedobacter sp.]|uniref:NUMOD4 domain-containing protein n=1 Tax=uncultured Empedobacter sp. TaxID=410844 RepID=UPI0025FF4132|nr:NUMOD4 domain-containing protein [uncultured Empedobacter sp.]
METWKDIKGYEGLYQVSDSGNVRSLDRRYSNGKGECFRKGKVLQKMHVSSGYHAVGLYLNKVLRQHLVHRLVSVAFIKNTNNNACVNHIDGIKTNNTVENLEWCSHSENTIHAFKIKLILPTSGIINGMSKLTEKDVLEIRAIGENLTQKEVCEIYNVSRNTIYNIINRRSWTHI